MAAITADELFNEIHEYARVESSEEAWMAFAIANDALLRLRGQVDSNG